jgi:hypothetical protein
MEFPPSLFLADMNEREYKIIIRGNTNQPQRVMQSTWDKLLEFKMDETVEGTGYRLLRIYSLPRIYVLISLSSNGRPRWHSYSSFSDGTPQY